MNIDYAMGRRQELRLVIKSYEEFLARQIKTSPERSKAIEALSARDIMRTIAMSKVSQNRVNKITRGGVVPIPGDLSAQAPSDNNPVPFSPEEDHTSSDKLFKNLKDCIPCNLNWDWKDFDWDRLREMLTADLKARLGFLNNLEDLFKGNPVLDELCDILHRFKDLCPQDILALIALLTAYISRILDQIEFNLASALSDILGMLLRPYIGGLEDFLTMYLQSLLDQIDCILNSIENAALSLKSFKQNTSNNLSSIQNSLTTTEEEKQQRQQASINRKASRAQALLTAAQAARTRADKNPSASAESAALKAEEEAERAAEEVDLAVKGIGAANESKGNTGSASSESAKITNSAAKESAAIPGPNGKKSFNVDEGLDDIVTNTRRAKKFAHDTFSPAPFGDGLGPFLRAITQDVLDWTEENLIKAQDAIIDLLGGEWIVTEKNISWLDQVKAVATIIDILEVIVKLKNGEDLCSEDNVRKVIDGINLRTPNGTTIIIPNDETTETIQQPGSPQSTRPDLLPGSSNGRTISFKLRACLKGLNQSEEDLANKWMAELLT